MSGRGVKRHPVLWFLAVVLAGGLVAGYLAMYVNPSKAWYMTLFGILFMVFAVLNAVMAIAGILHLSRSALFSLFVLIPAFFLSGRYIQFSGPESLRDGNLRVVSYNVGLFGSSVKSLKMNEQECMDSVFRFLLGTGADIICLQEFHFSGDSKTKDYLERRFPEYRAEYYLNQNPGGFYGNVILSRFPVRSRGKLDFPKSANQAIYADIDVRGTMLRVYNCHLESYNIETDKLAHFNGDSTLVRRTELKLRKSIEKRPEQVDAMVSSMESSPYESLVVGDFNDSPVSYTYRRLSRGRSDAFVKGGKGNGATFRLFWPFLRIDYILFPSRYECTRYEMPKVRYSDHYPIQADLVI
ncbi:MAG: endonuclease/exonuclease/phosphatase family protein [Bacteroidales bacterium]|nr:endonuclease/exonuclease/phosphatase family protein [Bacteroidales bacterium]MBQ4306774.1 endonuclease/exonuclease/phosphatase family protein [Bacteroidales bacterium]MBQ5943816.1 endonuclease/exonuclease/phosphatase family protein [Bacteroidales bacterium]